MLPVLRVFTAFSCVIAVCFALIVAAAPSGTSARQFAPDYSLSPLAILSPAYADEEEDPAPEAEEEPAPEGEEESAPESEEESAPESEEEIAPENGEESEPEAENGAEAAVEDQPDEAGEESAAIEVEPEEVEEPADLPLFTRPVRQGIPEAFLLPPGHLSVAFLYRTFDEDSLASQGKIKSTGYRADYGLNDRVQVGLRL